MCEIERVRRKIALSSARLRVDGRVRGDEYGRAEAGHQTEDPGWSEECTVGLLIGGDTVGGWVGWGGGYGRSID